MDPDPGVGDDPDLTVHCVTLGSCRLADTMSLKMERDAGTFLLVKLILCLLEYVNTVIYLWARYIFV